MMKNGTFFFSNRDCEYFPCHKGIPEENFNCMLCYCPLYMLGPDCGGNFEYLPSGIKSCMNCSRPHDPGRWDEMMRMMKTVVKRVQKQEETENYTGSGKHEKTGREYTAREKGGVS